MEFEGSIAGLGVDGNRDLWILPGDGAPIECELRLTPSHASSLGSFEYRCFFNVDSARGG
jgi:hypothetical protein